MNTTCTIIRIGDFFSSFLVIKEKQEVWFSLVSKSLKPTTTNETMMMNFHDSRVVAVFAMALLVLFKGDGVVAAAAKLPQQQQQQRRQQRRSPNRKTVKSSKKNPPTPVPVTSPTLMPVQIDPLLPLPGFFTVKVRNDTPYNSVNMVITYSMCRDDEAPGALAPGAIWEGP